MAADRCDKEERTLVQPHAAVAAFAVPTNRSGCITVAVDARRKAGERFEMNVDFDDSCAGCDCACGEYRQYVRGSFQSNGRQVIHLLPNPAGGRPLRMLQNNFREDGSLRGGNRFYGHRDDQPGNADATDRYLPQRATGCQYRGRDFPGLTGSPGVAYTINLDFRGQAIDVCNGAQVLQSNDWTVACNGTL